MIFENRYGAPVSLTSLSVAAGGTANTPGTPAVATATSRELSASTVRMSAMIVEATDAAVSP